jgi:ceramide glucosyltransferase
MFPEALLLLWSGAGLGWWIVAWWLVRAERVAAGRAHDAPEDAPLDSLTVFKPLPLLGSTGIKPYEAGLNSFAGQLDEASELLLGVHEADRQAVAPFLDSLRGRHPHARVKVVYRVDADDMANPKIAWQRRLAPHAEGTLWLWSDADIVAPPKFLRTARRAFAGSHARMMTFPYAVREIPSPPALLEAMFVNADFYPGVLLLRRFGPVDFGLGAAMLFRRDDFLREIAWDDLGARLADDFFLGRKLRPVVLGTATLSTVPTPATWRDALAHDLRWAKTIRWNRAGGHIARVLVLPVLGWLAAVAVHPFHFFPWIGLVGMVQADVLAAMAICREAGCRLTGGDVARLELWSLWRGLLWALSWLPGPVAWRGRRWRRPQAALGEVGLNAS